MFIHFFAPTRGLIIYQDGDGNKIARQGGSIAWRHCNPGNIRPGRLSASLGALGEYANFLVFPDEATGLRGIMTFVQSAPYKVQTVGAMFSAYAPSADHNEPAAYTETVEHLTGLAADRVIGSLSADELARFATAIKTVEGWIPGKQYLVPASQVALMKLADASVVA